MTMLNAAKIRQPLSGTPGAQLDLLEVFAEIGSTNSYLLDSPAPLPGRFRVALAEHQTAGRGRMDRKWQSPPSSGLCLSMSYTFHEVPEYLPSVTLAIGVGVAEALGQMGIRGIGLKWPNDLVVRDGKLGGILTEIRSSQGKAVTVVIGVGINVDLGRTGATEVIRPRLGYASDIASCIKEVPSRSVLSAVLIEKMFNTLAQFEADGLGPYFEAWERFDWLRGQRVSVEQPDGQASGVCRGIDVDGALILRTETGTERIVSGSVSLHGQQGDIL